MAVTHSFFNIMVSVIPLDKNVGCELHKEVELKAYRKIYVALRAVYYFPFIKNNPVDLHQYIIETLHQVICIITIGVSVKDH